MIIEGGDEGVGRVGIDLFTTQTMVAYLQDAHSDCISWYSHPRGVPSHSELGLVCVTKSRWQKLWHVTFNTRL